MAGDIVNLRLWRKRRELEKRKGRADENAARHGQPKAVTDLVRAREDKARRDHDAHRLEGESEDEA